MSPPVAVVGATGYTGRLVVEELVARGLEVVAVGRSAAKLEALRGVAGRRVADATDHAQVARALEGCAAVCSCVGPFVDYGRQTAEAAAAAGIPYVDTTGEQPFLRFLLETFSAAPAALVGGVGFDHVPGDMAAALAARALGAPPVRLDLFYRVTQMRASDGTKRTGLRLAAFPCLVWEGGRLVERRTGCGERRYRFPPPHGEGTVALWPGGEVLTVPRHTGAGSVAVYMRMPRVAAAVARRAGMATPLLRAGRSLVGSSTGGPAPAERRRSRFVVVAEASGGGRRARCVVEGADPYGLTAAACAEALVRMTSPGFEARGALGPAEAFEAQGFLDALRPFLTYRLEA